MERDVLCRSLTGKLIYFLPCDSEATEKSCVHLLRIPDWAFG